MVTVSDLSSTGCGFDSQPFHYQVTTLGKLLTHMCLCHQAVQFGTGQRAGDALRPGRQTVGLASHWPCGTDFSGLSTYGLNGQRKGDEHPTYAPVGVWTTLLALLS